jgi:hypothetical protein
VSSPLVARENYLLIEQPLTYVGCRCSSCLHSAGVRPQSPEQQERSVKRAEKLLRRYMDREQTTCWKRFQQILVTGSRGHKFWLAPAYHGTHRGMVRDDNTGTAVWPTGLYIAADWTVALKLLLEADEGLVYHSGCHGPVTFSSYPFALPS